MESAVVSRERSDGGLPISSSVTMRLVTGTGATVEAPALSVSLHGHSSPAHAHTRRKLTTGLATATTRRFSVGAADGGPV